MLSLMYGGHDYRRFAFGSADWDKVLRLDEHDRLAELVDE
jgi:hypothetical protein